MEKKALSTKCKNQLINKFVKAVKQAFGNLGTHKFWPAEAAQIEAYFNVFLSVWFFEKYKKNPKKFREGLKKLRINHIYSLLYEFIVIGLKVAKTFENYPVTRKEIADFSAFISAVAKEKAQGDLFCLKGTNKILSKKEVSNIIRKTKWTDINEKSRQEIGKLAAAAGSLDWALYFDIYASGGMVIHGPYRYKGNILIIKDWFGLNTPIWRIRSKADLKLYLLYRPIKGLRFDIMNHFTAEENMARKLLKFSVKSNGETLNIKEITKMTSYYNRLTIKQTDYVNKLKPVEIITKGAEIAYFMYKNSFDYYKEDWHPPKEVYSFIKKQGLRYWSRYKSASSSPMRNVDKFDPRKNFID